MTTDRGWNMDASFGSGVESLLVGARYRSALIAASFSVCADPVMPPVDRRIAVDQYHSGYRKPFWHPSLRRSVKIGD